jgi:hypothetical protein
MYRATHLLRPNLTSLRTRKSRPLISSIPIPHATPFLVCTPRYAAEEVLKAGTEGRVNVVLIPLDITSLHTIPFSSLIRGPSLSISGTSAPEPNPAEMQPSILRDFTDAILTRPREILASLGLTGDVLEMHDPVAAYFVIDHARSSSELGLEGTNGGSDSDERPCRALRPGWETTIRRFVIERQGEWTKGMCVIDRRYGSIGS